MAKPKCILGFPIDYPKLLLIVLIIQAIVVSCLLLASISELYRYNFIWIRWENPRFFDLFYAVYQYRMMNWQNVVVGLWFQFFFALDSYLHHNAMQVLVIPVLNTLLLGIQSYEYSLMAKTKSCYFGIEEEVVRGKASTNNSNYTIRSPPICEYSGTRLIYNAKFISSGVGTSLYQDNQIYVQNAYNLSLTALVFMVVFFVGICYLSFKTYRDYGWSIYRINGADIQKRNVLTRYHIFMLTLKLNILFAICDALPFLFGTADGLGFHSGLLRNTYQYNSDDLKHGGYGGTILYLLSSAWCLLSALLFFFVGVHAIRKCNYWLMSLLLVVYLVQVFIEGRLSLFMLKVNAPAASDQIISLYYAYWGVIVALEMAFDIFIVLLGSWVMYDFKHGLAELVNDMYDNKPWIFKKQPEHLKVKKERFIID